MEFILNYKKGISADASWLLSDERFSMGTDYPLSLKDMESLIVNATNKIYININRLMFDEDLAALKDYLSWLKDKDIAGIFFSDMAVYMLAKELEMEHLLIYAPGMPLVNHEDVNIYLSLGIQAVELANELTLEEKNRIMQAHPHQVGAVAFGYLLSSVSKRHFLSNYFKHIGQNHDVKKKYNLTLMENTRDGKMPIYEDNHGTYIYSEYILDSLAVIKEFSNPAFLRLDTSFLPVELTNAYLDMLEAVLAGDNAEMLQKELVEAYPEYLFSEGFYDTKTNVVKE